MLRYSQIMTERTISPTNFQWPVPREDPLEGYGCKVLDRQSVMHARAMGLGLLGTAFAAGFLIHPACLSLLAPALVCLWGIPWIFRSPPRMPSHDRNTMASPADGIVTDITTMPAPDEPSSQALRIRIACSLPAVQVNRSPMTGRITRMTHQHNPRRDQLFACTRKPAEKLTTCYRQGEGPRSVRVVQHASHRIISRMRSGDTVHCGNICGMSNFFSFIELFIPVSDADPFRATITQGQTVHAGLSVIGEWGHHGS